MLPGPSPVLIVLIASRLTLPDRYQVMPGNKGMTPAHL
jgi:hypothetical protein